MALDVDIDADTTWQEVFDALSTSEQSCIRDALGGELAQALTLSMSESSEELDESMFSCLETETAHVLIASVMISSFEQEVGELGEQDRSCLVEVVSTLDVGEFIASGEEPPAEFFGRIALCAPHVILAPFVFALSPDDLSEEEKSCLREAVSDPDVAARLVSGEEVPDEVFSTMVSCVSQPSAEAGPPLSLDEYAAWCSGISQTIETAANADITLDQVAGALVAARAVKPPGQVSDWHARFVILLRALRGLLDSEPEDDSTLFALFIPLALVQEAEDGLPADVRERLVEAGCIEPEVAAAQDDHGNHFDSATAITVGEPVEGSLGVGGDRDAFVFQAGANQNYEVDLGDYAFGSIGSAAGPLITVYGPDGRELARSDDQNFFFVPVWQSGAAGSYYVVVGDGAKNGDYTLTVQSGGVPAPEVIGIPTPESLGVATATPAPAAGIDDHGDDIASATVINVGEVVAGVVNGEDDTDFFGFIVEAGQTYHMEVMIDEKPDAVWFQFVILTDSKGMKIGWGDFQIVNKWEGGQLIQWDAPDSGDFYVGIEPGFKGWDPGSTYTLTITAAGQ